MIGIEHWGAITVAGIYSIIVSVFVFRSHFNRCTTGGVTQTYCCTIPQSPDCTKHTFEQTNRYLLEQISMLDISVPQFVVGELTAGL